MNGMVSHKDAYKSSYLSPNSIQNAVFGIGSKICPPRKLIIGNDRKFFTEAYTMKFANIERNILYLLGEEWLKSKTLESFDTKWIFDQFSDIPDKNMKDALMSIKEQGFVKLTSNNRNISLTQKGLLKIKVIDLPKIGKIPVPKKF
ncbi:MAG: hypothetical protein PVG74_06310 [Desulfobacterales bacterium]|jgi:hypothetical protein